MNKTRQFKRTAFNLSAKSMVSLMLLLIAMLMPQGAWAENFISEVKYGVHSKQDNAKGYLSGYDPIDHDFNNGTDGDWVYIGYKTSTNAADAITGLLVVVNDPESTATTYGDSGFKAGGAKTMMVDGKRYYLAEWGGNADMNNGNKTHKNRVYLYYTKDGNTTNGAQLITTLGAHRGELTTNTTGKNVVPLFGGNGSNTNGTYSLSKLSDFGDTNKGGGGSFNYITYTTHTHSYTAAFNWATNGKSCTATTNCAGCGDTHSNLVCTVTSAPKSGSAATCTVKGWTTYTAKITSNGKEFSATKDVQDIAALGHTYGAGAWSWGNDGHSATCTRTCSNDANHKSSASVTLGNGIASAQQVAPKCTEMGTTRYTATATVEGTQYSATKDVVDIAALGHSYGAGSWSWADDGHSATCTRTCGRTGCTTNTTGHTSSKSVTLGNGIASAQQVAANCTQKGTTRYTATATVEGTQYNATKDIVDIAALSHDYSQVVDEDYLVSAATCTKDAVYHEKCSRCDTHGTEWSVAGTKLPHTFADHICTLCETKDPGLRHGTQGECSWIIYSDGEMVISPSNGTAGSLGTWESYPSWSDASGLAKTVRFEGKITAQTAKSMFASFTNLTSLDLSNLNTADVTTMESMFQQCSSLESLDLSSFNTVNVTSMAYMFDRCSKLTSVDLSSFNTENVTTMYNMFFGTTSLTSLDLSSFDTKNVTNMVSMFRWCAFSTLTIANFNMLNVYSSMQIFSDCTNLNNLILKSIPYLGNAIKTKFSGEGKTVICELDENSAIYTGENPYFPEVSSVTYTRENIKNEWGTIVAPFKMGNGDDYDLYTLSEVSEDKLTLAKVSGTIEAGTPVIFRVKDTPAPMRLREEGNDEPLSITFKAATNAVNGQGTLAGSAAGGLQLIGTYQAKELTNDDYFISNNKFWSVADFPDATVKAAPFRAYLHSTGAGAKASSLSISIADGNATAIDTLNAITEGAAEYYDLSGKRILKLQKGINIVKYGNGKTIKVNIK